VDNFDKYIDKVLGHEGGYVNDLYALLKFRLYEESNKYRDNESLNNKRGYNCSQDNCDNPAYAKGYCNAHYIRSRKGGDMQAPVRNRNKRKACVDCGGGISDKGGLGRCRKHYKKRRAEIIKQVSVEYLGGKCTDCHQEFPLVVYDFHHTNPLEKDHTPSKLISNGSLEGISKEINKCVLLCSNCHRVRHGKNDSNYGL
jgi:hypothetical protein